MQNACSLVEMTVKVDNERLTVEVWDDGKGMSPEMLPRLFQHFQHTKGGTGLGLTSVAAEADILKDACGHVREETSGRTLF